MVAKPTPTAPPANVPNRDQPATFSTRADAWVAWEGGDFYPYLTTAVDFVEQEANAAEAARDAAEAARDVAALSAAATGAVEWTSGGSYTAGDVVWSPIDYYPYRAKTTHSGITTDPSADATRWANIALANVQADRLDNTPGRLLKVQAFGLGDEADVAHSPFTNSFNNNAISGVRSGLYYSASTAAATATGVTGNFPGFGAILAMNYFDDEQEYLYLRDGVGKVGAYNIAGGTLNWWDLYSQKNLLGTVSQTGGVPTGAAMQSGSNANGSWERFANGLQICTHTLATSTSVGVTWTFPAAFSATPVYSGGINAGAFAFVHFRAASSTDVIVSNIGSSWTRVGGFAHLQAIGRWF